MEVLILLPTCGEYYLCRCLNVILNYSFIIYVIKIIALPFRFMSYNKELAKMILICLGLVKPCFKWLSSPLQIYNKIFEPYPKNFISLFRFLNQNKTKLKLTDCWINRFNRFKGVHVSILRIPFWTSLEEKSAAILTYLLRSLFDIINIDKHRSFKIIITSYLIL